ncbi:stalk domain-containing protein [Paenibacillus sedimenti]|uniref:Copper amine oxidase N-terminal domain-containing protein n=1 Tax=Paenibacillus sedimenti TaxID=2770274 RepID=A0A926KZ18_9BACL|nr:stalk domain-containing protein [Paenibacillus sedimenti]MBD0384863.1 hypothetical protein [Paenibacillus sedimenti]
MKKAILAAALTAAMLLPTSLTSQAATNSSIQVVINGVQQNYEQMPQVIHGTTMVPMRAIFESLGAKIEWDEVKQEAIGTKNGISVELQIGSKKAWSNNKAAELEVAPQLINGKTMIPARYVSEALGMYVSWDNSEKTVYISEDRALNGRTKKEIKEKYIEYAPTHAGSIYADKPVVTAPYAPGKLQKSVIEDAVKRVNFVRYLAGMPHDIVIDEDLINQAQYGAVLTAVHKELNHYPQKPADMSEEFYKIGYESTKTSNLHSIYSSQNLENTGFVADSVNDYMSDLGLNNLPQVGHRRWILNPELQKMGFGFAENNNIDNWFAGYSSMQVLDESRTEKVKYDYVTWPSDGYFPNSLMDPLTPWSITLSKYLYHSPDLNKISVKLVRESDNRVWNLSAADNDVTEDGKYFNVVPHAYQRNGTVIFRPDGIIKYRDSDKFTVEISGIETRSQGQTTLIYEVNFFNL